MSVKSASAVLAETDEQYIEFEKQVWANVKAISEPVFTTDADPDALWDAYLKGIPEDRRQHYNCNCCRRFIQRYGGLVTIGKDGSTTPVLWRGVPVQFFTSSCSKMHRLVGRARVTGVFLQRGEVWGTPVSKMTGGVEWTHLSGVCKCTHFEDKVLSADQKVAERKEEYGMLRRGMAEYPMDVVQQALRVLKADTLDRSEKTLGIAQWLFDLHERVQAQVSRSQENIVWAAVATAPPGFCHVKTTMIGTLLDDIKSGMHYDDICERWKKKMHPLQYQRPTAPPKDGAIKAAEELFNKLDLAPALERRFATLDDVLVKLWVPPVVEKTERVTKESLFAHLKSKRDAKTVQEVAIPAVLMTWEKFQEKVLPLVLEMEVHCPSVCAPYYGLVTATNPDAPPIIQWDGLADMPRNPVSWYFYSSGSSADRWSLTPGWNKVKAVFESPHKWQDRTKFKHQGNNIHFAVDGARDTHQSELALFPEILRSEVHSVRSVLEAHSRSMKITGGEEELAGNMANGLAFQGKEPVTVRVKTKDGTYTYKIDRME